MRYNLDANLSLLALCVGAAIALCRSDASAADAGIESQLRQLKSADPDTRIEALRALQTSIDPRLPDALLALLPDEGNSIRRLAARGVGSRWWQIPKERTSEFVSALKRNLASSEGDEKNMAQRGLDLLTRDYRSEMTTMSANGRWVLYERYNLPCLIDTSTGTEELLGWSNKDEDKGWIASSWGNERLKPDVFWHREKDLVAIDMLLNRKESNVWIWEHHKGLRKLTTPRIAKAVGVRESQMNGGSGIYVAIKEWSGDELHFEFSFTTNKGETYLEHTAQLSWNARDDSLRMVSQKTEKQ